MNGDFTIKLKKKRLFRDRTIKPNPNSYLSTFINIFCGQHSAIVCYNNNKALLLSIITFTFIVYCTKRSYLFADVKSDSHGFIEQKSNRFIIEKKKLVFRCIEDLNARLGQDASGEI